MISFKQLLEEVSFYQYRAIVLFRYSDEENKGMGAEKLAEMVRALPGATRVSTASLNKEKGEAIMDVRLISQKSPKEAFLALKKNALKRFAGSILDVKIGTGTVEKKDFIQ